MNNFLSNLIARTTATTPMIAMRPASFFEPAAAAPWLPPTTTPAPSNSDPARNQPQPPEQISQQSPATSEVHDEGWSLEISSPKRAAGLMPEFSPPGKEEIERKDTNAANDSTSRQQPPAAASKPPVEVKITLPTMPEGSKTASQIEPESAMKTPGEKEKSKGQQASIIKRHKTVLPVVEEGYLEKLVVASPPPTSPATSSTAPQSSPNRPEAPPIVLENVTMPPQAEAGQPAPTIVVKPAAQTAVPHQPDSPQPIVKTRETIVERPGTEIERVIERPLPVMRQPIEKNELTTAVVNSPTPAPSAMPLLTVRPVPTIRAEAPPRQAEEPAPEAAIHVHIGRIEVRAVQPPPEPKSAKRPKTPVMSLDDYLARRNGGGKSG